MYSVDFVPWQRIYLELFAASTAADALQLRVTIPECNLSPVFRVAVTVATGGTVSVRLRFGFQNADTDASADTLLFPAIGVVGGQSGQLADTTTAANGALWSVPPRIAIYTTTVGFTGTVAVHVAMQVPK